MMSDVIHYLQNPVEKKSDVTGYFKISWPCVVHAIRCGKGFGCPADVSENHTV